MIESYRMWRIVTHWSLLFICWKNSIAPRSKPSCSCFSQGEALRTSAEAPPAECAFRKTRPFDHGSMMINQHDSDTSMIHWYMMIVYIQLFVYLWFCMYNIYISHNYTIVMIMIHQLSIAHYDHSCPWYNHCLEEKHQELWMPLPWVISTSTGSYNLSKDTTVKNHQLIAIPKPWWTIYICIYIIISIYIYVHIYIYMYLYIIWHLHRGVIHLQ